LSSVLWNVSSCDSSSSTVPFQKPCTSIEQARCHGDLFHVLLEFRAAEVSAGMNQLPCTRATAV
jgi:hypothetical protein